MKYVIWDIETTTKTRYSRQGNPFIPDNQVVVSGYTRGSINAAGEQVESSDNLYDWFLHKGVDESGEPTYRYDYPSDWFTKLLDGCKILVGHNIKYDLQYALYNPNQNTRMNRKAFMQWVTQGGRVWDTQLAEFLLGGMHHGVQWVDLSSLAPKYGGTTKVDEVAALWNAGVDTADIHEDLLIRYLIGDEDTEDLGDIGNTERVFLGQFKRALENGQMRSILLNQEALLFTVEAEGNGMFVDKDMAVAQRAKLFEELQRIEEEINQHIPDDLPFQFNWGSGVHRSALIFGGTVRYDYDVPLLDDDGNPVYPLKTITTVRMVDGSYVPLEEYERNPDAYEPERYKSGKRKDELKTRQERVPDTSQPPRRQREEGYYTFQGFTEPREEWATAREGVWSTASSVIEALGNSGVPFLELMTRQAALLKDMNTYYYSEPDKNGQTRGMLTLLGEDNIVHHNLNMVATVTARLSSSAPNLQNIPREGKSAVKETFVSRFGDDGVIVSSDFSSLEVYVQAIITGATQLVEDLAAGLDMHCVRLAAKTGRPYEEIYDLAKVQKIPEWEEAREGAKIYSFQRAYGAGLQTIAASTGMSLADVEKLAEAEDERYPEISLFYENLMETVRNNRVPTGRIEEHPEQRGLTVQLGRSHFRTPDGKVYSMSEHPSPKYLLERGVLTGFSPTELRNYPIQGTGAEWTKAAMSLLVRVFFRSENFGGKAFLINQVHDQVLIDCHKSELKRVIHYVHACMLEASTYMEWLFNWKLPIGVPSDTTYGKSWAEEHSLELDDDVLQKIRVWLRRVYMNNHTPSFGE